MWGTAWSATVLAAGWIVTLAVGAYIVIMAVPGFAADLPRSRTGQQ